MDGISHKTHAPTPDALRKATNGNSSGRTLLPVPAAGILQPKVLFWEKGSTALLLVHLEQKLVENKGRKQHLRTEVFLKVVHTSPLPQLSFVEQS